MAGGPRTTKTLAWRPADEAVLRTLRARVAAKRGVVWTERDLVAALLGEDELQRLRDYLSGHPSEMIGDLPGPEALLHRFRVEAAEPDSEPPQRK
jgi:hypothetical protein